MRIHWTFVTLLAVFAGCATAPPPAPTCAIAAITSPLLENGWWQAGDAACPMGGTLKVIDEKKSTVRMCLVDGRKHGPFRADDGEVLLSEGWYVWGDRHGRWRRYDGIQGMYVIEQWDCGRVIERLEDGVPTGDDPEG